MLLGLWRLKKIASKYKVDVVWSINLGSYFRLPVPNLLALNNAHQVYPWAITKFHPASPLRVALLRQFFRLSIKVADAVLVQTPLMADYVKRIKGTPRSIFVVPKAVERSSDVQEAKLPETLSRKFDLARQEGFRLWLYVATALPHKNHKVLFKAFSELYNKRSSDCLVLTISEEEAISVEGIDIKPLIKRGRLIFTGWVKKEYLRAIYDACDACVMPSLLESLSSTHLEAMEWKKPQIVADLPYARDLCGDAALYVDPFNSSAWADAILMLGARVLLQQELIIKGRVKIAEYPQDWSDCARRVREKIILLIG